MTTTNGIKWVNKPSNYKSDVVAMNFNGKWVEDSLNKSIRQTIGTASRLHYFSTGRKIVINPID